ncbi:MAG: metallophosphoesterase, partial [Acidimicrobiia bacterium]|nr:metallophosphoesterase [Acidimicrobiia bacterium]
DAVQLTWAAAPAGPLELRVGPHRATLESDGGPGSYRVDGLEPGSCHAVELRSPAGPDVRLSATTLARPPGQLLSRVATITDLHLGATTFGVLRTIRDPAPEHGPAPYRCARRAIEEALDWDASLVVAKGDLTNHGWRDQWDAVEELLGDLPVPTLAALGNHDLSQKREAHGLDVLRASGIAHPDPVVCHDLDGVRVVLVDSTADLRSHGYLGERIDDVADAVADADRPVLLCLHHPPERWPVPGRYPFGVLWPDTFRLMRRIGRIRRDVVVTAGHTHCNRVARWGGMPIAETSSTKDYPGCWTGYAVYEGGITQVTRRTAAPEVLSWTETNGRALLGWWRPYTTGLLSHRCFSHPWPARR